MIDFKPIQLSDRDWIQELLKKADFNGADYSFGNNFVWRDVDHIEVAEYQGFYLARSGKGEQRSYLYPAGNGDIVSVMEALIQDAKDRNMEFGVYSATKESIALLETLMPGKFHFEENRDTFDYIYSTEKLSTLSGKKYHSKRNHIARFKENHPDWTYEPITQENLAECIQMSKEWCLQNDCADDSGKRNESYAVQESLNHFTQLGYVGGLLRTEGRVVAFTLGEPLNSNTFITHIEKAFSDIQGAYPMINCEFAKHAAQGFEYINREDDTGSEGLRKAKLSYKPEILLEKYFVTLAE